MDLNEFLIAQPDALSYLDYVEADRRAAASAPGGAPLRVAILRNVTVETMIPVISGELLRAGFAPAIQLGEFDTIAVETLVGSAPLYAFLPDLIVVCQWLETISPRLVTTFAELGAAEVEDEIARALAQLESVLRAIRRNDTAPILVNDFPLLGRPTLGILDAQQPHGQTRSLLDLGARLREVAASIPDVYVVDFMRLSAEIGHADFFDAKQWQIARQPFGRRAQIAIAREIAAFARALRGRARKCLVLDCDDTLWGGAVGEDGIEGIALGHSYPGSCFTAFQREVLNLHARGVILALCSKNDEAEVLRVLREHPDMLVREEHLAACAVNWDDKATNLRRIAAELNIGLDALVFVDDNDFEVNLVRHQLPQVATILLPKDRARFAATLVGAALFDTLTLTEEDRRRTASYKANAVRARLSESSENLEEYLARLEMTMMFGTPTDIEVPRVAQLSQKTNQFNMTTRRYAEGEIRALRADDRTRIYVMKARDKASDLGLVGVIVMRLAGGDAEIDSFFVSCRALGRGFEDAFLAAAANDAFSSGRVPRVVGRYVPTEKNSLCRDFYRQRGFSLIEESDGTTVWTYDASGAPIAPPAWITVERIAEVAAVH